MRRPPRLGALLGTAFACALGPRTAQADGSGDHKAAAQVLFERAQSLVEQNHFAEACPQFAESERLDPGIGTLLWLADCYENTGQTTSAWGTFEQAAAMAAERRDGREAVALERAQKLEARLPRLVIVVSHAVAETPGLQIHCDGMPIESAAWERGILLDPGVHTITANATDRQLWWTTVALAAGSSAKTVTVPELAMAPSPPPPSWREASPIATASSSSEAPAASAPAHPGWNQRVAGIALGAAGVAGALVGAVFSLDAKARYDDSRAFCMLDNECSTLGKQDRSDASGMATVATVAMLTGAVGAGAGAFLYFTAPHASSVALAVSPIARGGALRMNVVW